MKINKKTSMIGIFLIVILVLTVNLISADLGVSSLYGKTSVLRMYPGESKDIIITVEGGVDDGELSVEAEITKGFEFISLIDGPQYTIPKGERVQSHVRVKIPEDSVVGTEYVVAVKFGEIDNKGEGEGTVSFVTTTTKTINVLVIEKPAEPEPEQETPERVSAGWIILAVILVILVMVVIYFLFKGRSSKPLK